MPLKNCLPDLANSMQTEDKIDRVVSFDASRDRAGVVVGK